MSATTAAIITPNIYRKLTVIVAESNSTKTTNPIIVATATGTGFTKPSVPHPHSVKEWGKFESSTPLFKPITK